MSQPQHYLLAYESEGRWENSLPKTGESLATERQAIRPVPPPAPVQDLLVPTISNDKGSGISPTPLTVET